MMMGGSNGEASFARTGPMTSSPPEGGDECQEQEGRYGMLAGMRYAKNNFN